MTKQSSICYALYMLSLERLFLCPCCILDEVLKMIEERGVDVASLDCTPFSDLMLVSRPTLHVVRLFIHFLRFTSTDGRHLLSHNGGGSVSFPLE